MKKIFFLVLLLSVFLVSSYSGLAFKVTPAKIETSFAPGATQEFRVFVGLEEAEVSVEGDLAPYVELPLKINAAEGVSEVVVTIYFPQELSPGGHGFNLVFTEKSPLRQYGQKPSGIMAKVRMNVPVSLMIPYPGKYLSLSSFEWDHKVMRGNLLFFNARVKNDGKEAIAGARGRVVFYDPYNDSRRYEALFTEAYKIESGQEVELRGEWAIPEELPFGQYSLRGNIYYDAGEINLSEYYFIYGDLLLEIVNVSRLELEQGKIMPMEIKVKSFWSQDISVMARVIIVDSAGKSVVESVSPATVIKQLAEGAVKVYIDGFKIQPGEYTMLVFLDYGGKETFQKYNLKVIPAQNMTQEDIERNEVKRKEEILRIKKRNIFLGIIIGMALAGFLWRGYEFWKKRVKGKRSKDDF